MVVYCEVIEHLAYDPTQTLVEAHRVLAPGTGTHARHHRLFSLAELRHLVEQVGFEVTRALRGRALLHAG